MERFFYSIIASCLIEFLASRSLTLSISKQDDSVHSISLLTGGHRSGRIPSAAGGEEVQRWRCRRRRRRKPMRTVLSEPAGTDEDPPRPCSLPSCGQIPPARLNDISPTWGITSCTGPAPQVAACGFSSMRLLPSSPCIVARVRRLVQHHLLVLL